jgi:hypothetical protein
VAQVAGVSAYHPYEESDVSRTQGPGGMDTRIEEVNEVDWVVKEENAGLLVSALEGVPFEDAYQWEEVEVDVTEKGAQSLRIGYQRRKLHVRG